METGLVDIDHGWLNLTTPTGKKSTAAPPEFFPPMDKASVSSLLRQTKNLYPRFGLVIASKTMPALGLGKLMDGK
ncbi:MAG: hypothetical protein GX751_04930 [Desulfuromonadaceae bacterium]|nr:hypothetical protein [Desulfuromonadaceae bacterium]NLV25326.1 hypothetical protein [Deltaproteobacteria bacterium]